MKIRSMIIALLMAGIGVLSLDRTAGAVEYKEYKFSHQQTELFAITFDKEEVRIKTFDSTLENLKTYQRKSIKVRGDAVYAGDQEIFDSDGLIQNGSHYFYENISDTRVTSGEDYVTITFLSRILDTTSVSRFRLGNLLTFTKPVTVEKQDFVRGFILSVAGDVEISGEVNKDVISLFGNIYLAPGATARGDLASVTGHVNVAGDASVYGELYFIDRRGHLRHNRFVRKEDEFSTEANISYNRVDGVALYAGVRYRDADSLLPTLWGKIGYAFNPDRWRYEIGLEQTIMRHPVLAVGGTVYRRLASEDDWLIGNAENSAFALLVKEDYKDYYEAEGGNIYAKIRPINDLIFETGYRYEQTKWLDARRHLWSLFGGDRLFDYNFGTVPSPYREIGIAETDTTTNAVWYNHLEWDTRLDDQPFARSGWHASADFELSLKDANSDFDYNRYTVSVRRYQKINRNAMLLARVICGGSGGYLPMYKRFFLGGLGTLSGYKHKEYMGTRFWMANTEYRISFPHTELAAAVLWDVGRIANDTNLGNGTDVKHDLGIALYVGDDFKVSLAKRLDRAYDDDPKFYVRLNHSF